MGRHRSYRRSDLFLVRLWAEEADGATDAAAGGSDSEDPDHGGNLGWHGKVQRVVDGEAHQFSNWQDLCDLLAAMISNRRIRR